MFPPDTLLLYNLARVGKYKYKDTSDYEIILCCDDDDDDDDNDDDDDDDDDDDSLLNLSSFNKRWLGAKAFILYTLTLINFFVALI